MAEAYINYDEYKALGGNAEASAFPLLERKAEKLLDYWTFNRIKYLTIVPDEVKECLTEMVNRMMTWEDGQNITSFSNGKVSIAFDSSKSREQNLFNDVALVYLPVSLISEVVE